MLKPALGRVARCWPFRVEADDDAVRALGFLGTDVDAETVDAACYATAVGTATLAALLGVVLRAAIPAVLMLAVTAVVGYAGPAAPRWLARAKRTRALGAAPGLVARATSSMKRCPAPERAARFAAETGDGVLARSLAAHVRRSASGPRTGLRSFADEWRAWFPELRRACALVESANGAAPDQRAALLDRARRVVLDAARDRTVEYAASIRGPATALYAFGVLLPLALVSLLPALGAAGVPASTRAMAVAYDVLLPAGLLGASARLLARRPVAFPPPAVDRSHPDVPVGRVRAPLAGLGAGALAGVVTRALLSNWATPIAIVGVAVGTALAVRYRPRLRVREGARAVEDGLSDALSLLGRRVERGESVEAALPRVAEALPGATGDVFDEAARRQRRLGVGVEEAFLGPEGALATVPSERARGAASLVALAATEGRTAGEAVTEMGDHLRELRAVEAEARRSVERVAGALSNTAAFFGPLVGGATVALAGAMGGAGPLAGGDVAGLGLIVGWYVLVLAAVLAALGTGLARGFDVTLVGYRVGLALLAATGTFLAAVAGTRSIL